MPGNYDGRTGSITLPTALTVTNASNTNPITITVTGSLPAEFFLGGTGYGGNPAAPLVDISGVLGNTAANGVWVATPTGASTFTIPTAGIAAYTAGGSVQPLYLQSPYTLPVDGDADNSASIASWGQATGDRTQWLAGKAVGAYKLANTTIFQYQNETGSAWAHIAAGNLVAGTKYTLTSDGVAWGVVAGAGSAPNTAGVAPLFSIPGAVFGDLVRVRLDTTDGLGGQYRLALYAQFEPTGVSGPPSFPSGWGTISASKGISNGTSPAFTPVSLAGAISSASMTGTLWIQPIVVATLTSAGQSISLVGDTSLVVDYYRPTGMPQ